MRPLNRRKFVTASTLLGSSVIAGALANAQEGDPSEPVYRISKKDVARPETTAHALDPALKIAYQSLQHIRSTINDYTAIMRKRERIDGVLSEYEYLGVKVRNRKVENGQLRVPFSVYTTFLAPNAVKGREAIYVENKNSGNLIAHEGGMKGKFLPTVTIDPNGMLAMRGQRYPITDMGVENLVIKLIEKGERDRKAGPCGVSFAKGAKVDNRDCIVLTVKHDERKPCYDFHTATIYIDTELNIPVCYAAYEWPDTPGGKPILLEEYTYSRIKTNVGLTDDDFNPKNPKYNF